MNKPLTQSLAASAVGIIVVASVLPGVAAGAPVWAAALETTPVTAHGSKSPLTTLQKLLLEQTGSQIRANEIIGHPVLDRDGENTGTVDDLIFDEDGRLVGFVLKVGAVLGFGGKLVAVKRQITAILPPTKDRPAALQVALQSEELSAAPAYLVENGSPETELEPNGAVHAPKFEGTREPITVPRDD